MTGTAMTEAAEFDQIYKLGVVPIPTNRADDPHRRARPRLPHRGGEVQRRRRRHRRAAREGPAGPRRHRRASRSPSTSPTLLRKRGVPHEVLNAKHHEREAAIVAQAGRKGAVTVATNMAGRGTDIMLGGNPEFLAVGRAARSASSSPVDTPEEYEAAWPAALERGQEGRRGRARGGRRARRPLRPGHRAPRVAPHRQPAARPLRPPGRPGRDALLPLARGRPDAAVQGRHRRRVPAPLQRARTTCRSRRRWSRNAIRSAQTQVEAQNFEIRKNVLKYDEVHEPPARRSSTSERRRVLEGEDLHEQVRALHRRHRSRATSAPRPPRATRRTGTSSGSGPRSSTLYPVGAHRRGARGGPAAAAAASPREYLIEELQADAHARLRRARGGRSAPRSCASSSAAWCSRCSTASGASTSTRWTTSRRASACARWRSATRSWSTSARASTLFDAMMEAIKEESVGYLFNVEVQVEETPSIELTPTAAPAFGEAAQARIASLVHLQRPSQPSRRTATARALLPPVTTAVASTTPSSPEGRRGASRRRPPSRASWRCTRLAERLRLRLRLRAGSSPRGRRRSGAGAPLRGAPAPARRSLPRSSAVASLPPRREFAGAAGGRRGGWLTALRVSLPGCPFGSAALARSRRGRPR